MVVRIVIFTAFPLPDADLAQSHRRMPNPTPKVPMPDASKKRPSIKWYLSDNRLFELKTLGVLF